MLCLPGFGTHANVQNLPHFRAFPASIQEHSPPKCLFFMANAKLPNRPLFALPPVQGLLSKGGCFSHSKPWKPRKPRETYDQNLKTSPFEILREWPRYCRKVYWTKMVQNGPNDHFGQNNLIPNRILAFARPKSILVHFGLKRSILVLFIWPLSLLQGMPSAPQPISRVATPLAWYKCQNSQNWGTKNQPKVLLQKVFQIRDVPTQIPGHPSHSLKQQKKATCINFLSGISRRLGPGCPRNILPKHFMFRLFFRTWKMPKSA